MIAPSSLSAFSVPTAVPAQPSQAASGIRQARGQPQAAPPLPATTTQQLQSNPPAHPGRVVPRGSLLDLKV